MWQNLPEHQTSGLSLHEYHDKCLDGTMLWETYLRKGSPFCDDTIEQIFSALIKIFSSVRVKGNTMIQMSLHPIIHYNFPACEYFTEIIVGTATDRSFRELEKWWKNEANAIDMSHIAQFVCEGEGNRETGIEKQNILRRKVKNILKYDITKSNPFSPVVLPQVDCLMLSHCLEMHALNKEDFCSALKNASSLLKPGGDLIMVVAIETTFYMVGKFKFPHLCFDVDFLRKPLTDNGYFVEELKVLPRKAVGLIDVCDYSAYLVLKAHKEAEGLLSDKRTSVRENSEGLGHGSDFFL
ncbi:nicotinamide N-methyltransferase-like [Ambystoma mexicanum]|uniref:nicotinamide N-methyltransferase-like n=1 Tax=Ambystoma mexicanum TaxID=8296 RepID=UPI0037E952C2